MKTQFLETVFGDLAYTRIGTGGDVSLLFHGFGQNRKAYDPFICLRKETERFLVFDIFYHGQSSWKKSGERLTKKVWREIIKQLMQQEGFDRFRLIGYSMGGKFCLITYELFPQSIESMLLMAPDGIKTGFWYNMATFPGFLNRLFKWVVFHPSRFFKFMDTLYALGLLESSLIKFVKSQMQTRTLRAQLFFTWSVFKPLRPEIQGITKLIKKNGTPTVVVTGLYDKMVTSQNLQDFCIKAGGIPQVELACGHNDLIEKTAEFLEKSG